MKPRDKDDLDTGPFGTWATMMEGHDIAERWNLNQPEYPFLGDVTPDKIFQPFLDDNDAFTTLRLDSSSYTGFQPF